MVTPADTTNNPLTPEQEPRHKPAIYQIDFAEALLPPALIPLTSQPRWVCWRWEWRQGKGTEGKWTKPPIQPGHRFPAYARNNDPSTWGTFAEAVQRVTQGEADGVGFCLLGSDVGAVDLDDCYSPGGGASWAWDLVRRAPKNTYCEMTVSGTGLRLIGLGTNDELHRKFPAGDGKGSFELYRNTARYITVSGKALRGEAGPLPQIDNLLNELLAGASRSGNGAALNKNVAPAFRHLDPKQTLAAGLNPPDESGSGYGFRFMRDCHTNGLSYEQARAAVLADKNEAGEWANRVDERQLERAWERSKPLLDPAAARVQLPAEQRLVAAAAVIPNADCDKDTWNKFGLALFRATAGSDDGLTVFHAWSSKSKKYDEPTTTNRWESYKTCPPTTLGAGSIFQWANEASPNWEMLTGVPLERAIRIAALIPLSAFDYDLQRKAVAEELEIRVVTLDEIVERLRPRRGPEEEDGKQGRAITLLEPEPWPERVDGPALLDDIAATIKRYVVLSEHACHTTVLWGVFTYLLDEFMISPRLAVDSPVRRCGKTTLLDIINWLVYRPLPTANVTAPAVFRIVDAYRPALLIDEADTFLGEANELRGILNSGHRKGGQVLRTVGDDHEPRAFSTYSAVAIALIGELPDTLADRSVVVHLKRKTRSEKTESFRIDRVGHLEVLARKTARWVADNRARVAAIDPVLPDPLFNREADNWRPLATIAEAIGGAWPQRVEAAARAAAGVEESDSLLELVLGDIRGIFARRKAKAVERQQNAKGATKREQATKDVEGADKSDSWGLVSDLVKLEERPWAELGKFHKPLTQHGLARLLKPLGIAPELVRIGDTVLRGYRLSQFSEAFERYLPSEEGLSDRYSVTNADGMGISGGFQTVTGCPDVTVEKCEKSNNDGLCNTVTVQKGGPGGKVSAEGENDPAKVVEGGGRDDPETDPTLAPTATEPVPSGSDRRASPATAPAGTRCCFCGKGGGVRLVRRQGEHESAQAHIDCAGQAWGQSPVTLPSAPSQSTIDKIAAEYLDRACTNAKKGGDPRTAECDVWLRQRLDGEGVLPEQIEAEIRRVRAAVVKLLS
jgi:Protein of unknown function (DUF3631)/Primase C terminal 2 (PriCT-2)